jgi:hypothetical protein
MAGTQALLWGDLEHGPYRVGYRTNFRYDFARPPIDEEADLRAESRRGRPMQISAFVRG